MSNAVFEPTEQTKELWRIQLEMCDVLLAFCKENQLRIWACFGTLLGAVRHKGFIPWDDDVDFVMTREDYDRLMSIIKTSNPLQEPYVFDDKDMSVLRLRRNDTTMVNLAHRWGKGFNNGVWIDIFPLEVAPDEIEPYVAEYTQLKRKLRAYQNATCRAFISCNSFRKFFMHTLLSCLFIFIRNEKFRKHIEDHLRNDSNRFSGKTVWPYLCWCQVKTIEKVPRYETSWFSETVMLPFEDRQLPCPKEYERVLETQYGDWRTPVRGGSLHEGTEFYPIPFEQYTEEQMSSFSCWKRFLYTH